MFKKFRKNKIYFDTASFSRISILDAFSLFVNILKYKNAGSLHSLGDATYDALNTARKLVARYFGSHGDEIFFTSGATEALNLSIMGLFSPYNNQFDNLGFIPHVIISEYEHSAVLNTVKFLESIGVISLTKIKPNIYGEIESQEIRKALKPETVLVSVMMVNNEIGTINDIYEITKTVRHHRRHHVNPNLAKVGEFPLVHTDISQAYYAFQNDVEKLGVDIAVMSSEKVFSGSGVGVLFKKRSVNLKPIIFGGSQEYNLRAGTENVPAIVTFANVLARFNSKRENYSAFVGKIKDYFLHKLIDFKKENDLDVMVNSNLENSSPHIVSFMIREYNSGEIVSRLNSHGIMVSSKSACHSREDSGSHVLRAIYENQENYDIEKILKSGAVRVSFDYKNSKGEVEKFFKALKNIIQIMKKARA